MQSVIKLRKSCNFCNFFLFVSEKMCNFASVIQKSDIKNLKNVSYLMNSSTNANKLIVNVPYLYVYEYWYTLFKK